MDDHLRPPLVKIHIKNSKNQSERKGADVYVGDTLHPVAALLADLATRGAPPGPLFELQDGTSLTKDYFKQKFDRYWIRYARHSFKIGAATEKGIEDSIINEKMEKLGLPKLYKDSPSQIC